MSAYTDQVQERLDRLEHMEPIFNDLLAALEEIAKGEGEFSRDPLMHAENTIDSMKAIAAAALAKVRGKP